MQFPSTILALLAFNGLSQAVLPACSTACIAAAVTAVTTCAQTDLACQCANLTVIETSALACVLAACTDPLGKFSPFLVARRE